MEKRPNHRPPKPRAIQGELADKKYTIAETAELMELHPNTIRRAIKTGELQAKKYGRDWIIKPEAIKNYIERSESK